MNDKEDVKQKLDIVEVIREYIPVKAVGANFQAICPFHNEKTPSFVISPEKQIWHCFGCDRGGDVFSFVMEKEGIGFREALKMLAEKAGVVLQDNNFQDNSKLGRLREIMELSGKYYAHILKTPAGVKALEYLHQRGLKDETIQDWQLGYSPDSWTSLYDFLRTRPKEGKKFSEEEIAGTGMIIKKDKVVNGRQYYDRFRGRIMFPIHSTSNNLIAFTARISPEKEKTEKMGKYINSPQTEVYDKSRVVFGLNKAKSEIRQQDLAIVVEGQMDVISCFNHDIENVVATSGTALSSYQLSLIKRFTNNLALSFDMDEAGQNAADRGIKEALNLGMNVKVITISGGKDPDEILKTNPDEFKNNIQDAKPVMEYYYAKISSDIDLSSLENKAIVRDKMFDMISYISNKSDQGHWLKIISENLDFSETDIREEFIKFTQSNTVNKNYNRGGAATEQRRAGFEDKTEITKNKVLSREDMLMELFLALLLRFPTLIPYATDNLDASQLQIDQRSLVYKNLIIYYNKSASFDYKSYVNDAENDEKSLKILEKLALLGEKEFYSYSLEEAKKDLITIILEIKRRRLHTEIRELEKQLLVFEKNGEDKQAEIEDLMREIKNKNDDLTKLSQA